MCDKSPPSPKQARRDLCVGFIPPTPTENPDPPDLQPLSPTPPYDSPMPFRIANLRWFIAAIVLALLLTQVAAPLLLTEILNFPSSSSWPHAGAKNDRLSGHIWGRVPSSIAANDPASWPYTFVDDIFVTCWPSSSINVHFEDEDIPFPIDLSYVASQTPSDNLVAIRRVGVPMKWISFASLDPLFAYAQGQTPPPSPMHNLGSPWPLIEPLPLALNILIVSAGVTLLFLPPSALLLRRHRLRTGKCLRCAYPIPVTPEGDRVTCCPECGTATSIHSRTSTLHA